MISENTITIEKIKQFSEEEKEKNCCEIYDLAWNMCQAGDLEHLKTILQIAPSVVTPPIDGIDLLGVAVERGHYEVAKCLLEHGADPDRACDWGETPIEFAADAKYGHKIKMIELLLEYGAEMEDAFSKVIQTCDDEKVLQFICDYLRQTKKEFSGWKFLTSAMIGYRSAEFVETLLELGAKKEINYVLNGETILDSVNACIAEQEYKDAAKVKEVLEKHDAKTGNESVKKIHEIICNASKFAREEEGYSRADFIEKISEIENLQESLQETCHPNGRYDNFSDLIGRLLRYGGVLQVKELIDGMNDYSWISGTIYEPPMFSLERWTEAEWEIYYQFICKLAEDNVKMEVNPFFGICGRKRKETEQYSEKTKEIITKLMDLYISCGADINGNQSSPNGYTPLASAVWETNEFAVDYLLKEGVQVVSQKKDPLTFLLFSVYSDDLLEQERSMFFKLKAHGLDIDETDDYGNTVLHKICRRGKFEKAKLIVECGAKMDLKNSAGKTAADLALENGHMDIYEYLMKKIE